jgi:hypothetical protein
MTLGKKQKLEIERLIKERRATIAAELHRDVEKAREEQYAEPGEALIALNRFGRAKS